MLPNRASFWLIAGLAMASGCTTDVMNGTDGISPVAGLAQINNANVHIINRHAGYRATANPGMSGKRAATVIEAYSAPDEE